MPSSRGTVRSLPGFAAGGFRAKEAKGIKTGAAALGPFLFPLPIHFSDEIHGCMHKERAERNRKEIEDVLLVL